MTNIGIWIDKEKAHLVTLKKNEISFKTLQSEVENFHPKGGSGSRVKWGGLQDVVKERTYLEREKQQLKKYFANVAHQLSHADAIAIFGPSDTPDKLQQELSQNYKSLHTKLKSVVKCDSMTENQVKALVKEFFKSVG
ncbi:MAG: hypothetical protein WBN39_01700 [Flavobacteriaceae bacterium]